MDNLWTPLNGETGERMAIPREEVTVTRGSPLSETRRRGRRGWVRWNGREYNVTGISCGLPGCNCDVRVDPV